MTGLGARLRRIGPYAAGIAAAEVAVAWTLYWLNEVFRSDLRGPDFFSYYAIAHQQLERGPAHAYDLVLQKQFQDQVTSQWPGQFILLPHILPPYFTILLAPLGWLPFRVAYGLWGALTIAMVAGGVAALLRAGRIEGRATILWALIAAAYLPVFVLVLQGQSDGLAVLGLGLSAWAWSGGHEGRAGFFAALALAKPQLVLLVPILFLARRSWPAVAAFAATAAILVAGSLPFFGVAGWRDYINLLLTGLLHGYPGFSLETLSVFSVRGTLERFGTGTPAALAVVGLLYLAAAAAMTRGPASPRLDFALAVAISMALSPYQHMHDLALLLVPTLLLAGMLLGGELAWRRLGWAVLAGSYLGVQLFLALGATPAALGVFVLAGYLMAERIRASSSRRAPALRSAAGAQTPV